LSVFNSNSDPVINLELKSDGKAGESEAVAKPPESKAVKAESKPGK
jgi:hypothetical protein